MIFNNKTDHCLNFLENLNYPKEFLNITVFSDREILHKYKNHRTTEKEAYEYIRLNSQSYYSWIINADYIINNVSILSDLVKENKDIISGLMIKTGSAFSNFWGAISPTGWYARSDDYLEIFNLKKIGVFKVPYATGNLLIKNEVFKRNPNICREQSDWDLDMSICHNLRLNGEEIYILNRAVYGFIEESNITKGFDALAPFTEETAIHKDFLNFMQQYKKDRKNISTNIFKSIGPDIWQIPFFTEAFCDHLISIAEKKNEWSGGTYTKPDEIDKRIGAIENFPTQDIHLTQLGLDRWWLDKIIGEYFKAILYHLYSYHVKGYNISFIVKYSEKGQTKLDAHHDAAAYTTNIALNTHGKDYTGGGVNFVHKNVQCIGNPKGFLTLHPGRITHFHEALPIDSGTRYILVSFNN